MKHPCFIFTEVDLAIEIMVSLVTGAQQNVITTSANVSVVLFQDSHLTPPY